MRIVCLTGIDGTGKTTCAQALAEALSVQGFSVEYVWLRWEPFLLRWVGRRLKKKCAIENAAGDGFGKADIAKKGLRKNKVLRVLWAAGSLFDYWLTKRFVLCRYRKCEILVCDRYVYDYAVDLAANLGWSQTQMLRFLKRWVFLLFPEPNLTVHLILSPEVAAKRKSDGTSVEYLQNRYFYYSALDSLPRVVEVSAGDVVEVVSGNVIRAVAEVLNG